MKSAVWVSGARKVDRAAARQVIREALAGLPPGTVVLHGDAAGVDEIAGLVATHLGLPQVKVPFFGWLQRAGGPARNALLLELLLGLRVQGREVRLFAFAGDAGTEDSVRRAEKAGVPVQRFPVPAAAVPS